MLTTVYLRCDSSTELDLSAVNHRLQEATDLGAKYLRIVGSLATLGVAAIDVIGWCRDAGLRISGDVAMQDLIHGPSPLQSAVERIHDLALNVSPTLHIPDQIDLSGLTLNIPTNRDIVDQVVPFARCALEVRGARLVKVDVNLQKIGDPIAYMRLVDRILELHEDHPEQVYALLPWSVAGIRNLKITRTVCDYSGVVGLFVDGAATVCKVGRELYDPPESLLRLPLSEVLSADPMISRIRAMRSHDLKGICAKCAFRDYCGNLCPARVFHRYGDFARAFPDCEGLQAAGLFPGEFINGQP